MTGVIVAGKYISDNVTEVTIRLNQIDEEERIIIGATVTVNENK